MTPSWCNPTGGSFAASFVPRLHALVPSAGARPIPSSGSGLFSPDTHSYLLPCYGSPGRALPHPIQGAAASSAAMESLQQLEVVCEQLYNSPDPATRRQSEQLLRGFGSNPEYIPQCKAILDNSANPFAQARRGPRDRAAGAPGRTAIPSAPRGRSVS